MALASLKPTVQLSAPLVDGTAILCDAETDELVRLNPSALTALDLALSLDDQDQCIERYISLTGCPRAKGEHDFLTALRAFMDQGWLQPCLPGNGFAREPH
jgi:hypothetical protein